jgi:hypothetical protein
MISDRFGANKSKCDSNWTQITSYNTKDKNEVTYYHLPDRLLPLLLFDFLG